MDVHTIKVDDIPKEVKDELYLEYRNILKIFEIEYENKYRFIEFNDYICIREDTLPGIIPDRLIQRMEVLLPDSGVESRFKNVCDYEHRHMSVLENLFMSANILGEHMMYIKDGAIKPPGKAWFIYATFKGYIYGGIFAFWNPEEKRTLFIQGICQCPTFALLKNCVPSYKLSLPHLNTVLESSIEDLAVKLGATRILVIPVGDKQGEILAKYYGYILQDKPEVYYPCDIIAGYDHFMDNPDEVYSNVYQKDLPLIE